MFVIEAKKAHVIRHHIGYMAMHDNEPCYIIGVSQLPVDDEGNHVVMTRPLTVGDVLEVKAHPYTGEIVLQRIEK